MTPVVLLSIEVNRTRSTLYCQLRAREYRGRYEMHLLNHFLLQLDKGNAINFLVHSVQNQKVPEYGKQLRYQEKKQQVRIHFIIRHTLSILKSADLSYISKSALNWTTYQRSQTTSSHPNNTGITKETHQSNASEKLRAHTAGALTHFASRENTTKDSHRRETKSNLQKWFTQTP